MSAPEKERLTAIHESPSILMATAPNAGPKTLEGTHTYIISRTPGYLVDPGPALESHLDAVLDSIARSGTRLAAVLLTHGHPDHAPGAVRIADRLDIPIFASGRMNPADLADGARLQSFPPRASFAVDGDVIEVIESPGHTDDHVAFWLPRSRVLLAGDTVLGRGSTLVQPPEGDMTAYMHTLHRFVALRPRLLLPGHGPIVADPATKLQEYIAHRVRREQEILEMLHRNAATPNELVEALYEDVSPVLRTLALGSVRGTLRKLVGEARVVEVGDRFHAV